MSTRATLRVNKGQTVRWEVWTSAGTSAQRRIRNYKALATYTSRGSN